MNKNRLPPRKGLHTVSPTDEAADAVLMRAVDSVIRDVLHLDDAHPRRKDDERDDQCDNQRGPTKTPSIERTRSPFSVVPFTDKFRPQDGEDECPCSP